jgi:hypothetical protein
MKKIFLFAVTFVALFATSAQAHWADLAAAEISSSGTVTQILLTFPTGLVVQSDDDGDQVLSPSEIQTHQSELTRYFEENITVTDSGGQTATLSVSPATEGTLPPDLGIAPGTHSTVKLLYTWTRPPQGIMIDYNLFLPGVSTASCIATIVQEGKTQTFVFTPENRTLTLEGGEAPFWSQVGSFIVLGLEHILTGYDHLLFLLALLALGGGLGYLLKVVSAFTLAHSITLSLAVLNVVTLPPRLVESLIALSIAYVAAENLWRKREGAERWRWLITFGFGLIHGLGFANILRDMALPKATLAASLVSFNVGVEIGQLAFMSVAFLLLTLMRRWRWDGGFRYVSSLAAIAVGMFWFVQRAFFS